MLKPLLKQLLFAVALVLTAPLIVIARIESAVAGPESERVYGGCKELLATVPTILGQYFRAAFYWASCQRVSPDICMQLGSMLAHRETSVGKGVVIGSYTTIGRADIGDHALISARVSLVSGKYQHGLPSERGQEKPASARSETIRIGCRTWIGEGAVILASVGDECTVSAGAVVYNATPDGATLVGNPARRVDRVVNPPAVEA